MTPHHARLLLSFHALLNFLDRSDPSSSSAPVADDDIRDFTRDHIDVVRLPWCWCTSASGLTLAEALRCRPPKTTATPALLSEDEGLLHSGFAPGHEYTYEAAISFWQDAGAPSSQRRGPVSDGRGRPVGAAVRARSTRTCSPPTTSTFARRSSRPCAGKASKDHDKLKAVQAGTSHDGQDLARHAARPGVRATGARGERTAPRSCPTRPSISKSPEAVRGFHEG